MTLLVTYLDFHWDNYQGGSGKSFQFNFSFQIEDATPASEIWEVVHKKISEHSNKSRPFNQKGERPTILKVELLYLNV